MAAVRLIASAQVLEGFSWVDLKTDTKTVDRVAYLISSKPYTALREIGLVGDQALVITTLRKDPIAQPANDLVTVYSVSLHDGLVVPILEGANLRIIEWQKLYDIDTPELLATYDDCTRCQPTTFLTAFYIDRKTKRWMARWNRQVSGAPLTSADPNTQHIYALFMNVDQRVVLETWTVLPEQKKSSRGGEFMYEYRIDAMSDQGTGRPVTGRDMLPMKQRLCRAEDVVYGIMGGQDSDACRDLLKPAMRRR